jgi:hypothetical protein
MLEFMRLIIPDLQKRQFGRAAILNMGQITKRKPRGSQKIRDYGSRLEIVAKTPPAEILGNQG